jgi:hypothetical protein
MFIVFEFVDYDPIHSISMATAEDTALHTLLSQLRKAERNERRDVVDAEAAAAGALFAAHRAVRLRNAHADSISVAPGGAAALPEHINSALFPHQRAGIEFFRRMHHMGPGGCIMADEMGLGKTVQTSTFIGDLIRRGHAKKILLTAPTSMIDPWLKALTGMWGGLPPSAVAVYGATMSQTQRRKLWAAFTGTVPALPLTARATPQRGYGAGRSASSSPPPPYGAPGGEPLCVLIATAGVIQSDIDFMETFRLDYAVLDEAQMIRNPSTKAFLAITRLQAVHRVAITGTPVMNSLMDLWSIVQFVDRSLITVSRAAFSAASKSAMRGNERDASTVEMGEAEALIADTRDRVAQVTLRRTKAEIELQQLHAMRDAASNDDTLTMDTAEDNVHDAPQLPAAVKDHRIVQSTKAEVVVWVKLTPEQRRLYKCFLNSEEVVKAKAATNQSCCFVLLSRLKKLCDHPFLELTKDNYARAMRTPFETLPGDLRAFGNVLSGGKIEAVLRLVTMHKAQGLKTVIFSESKVLLQIVATVLAHRIPGVHTLSFTGDVPIMERGALMDRWNTDPSLHVCLATTAVGGVGVTMTGACRAIIMDPSWNPAVDSQAVDRVHRIGQKRDVIVYRLITCGTVEEKTYRRQIAKLHIARLVNGDEHRGQAPSSTPARCINADFDCNTPTQAPVEGAATPAGKSAAVDRVRYFTKTQLRDLFVFDEGQLDVSGTAQLVRKVHGRTLPPTFTVDTGLVKGQEPGDEHRLTRCSLRVPEVHADDTIADVSDHLALFTQVHDADSLTRFLEGDDAKSRARIQAKRRAVRDDADDGASEVLLQRRGRGHRTERIRDSPPPVLMDPLADLDDMSSQFLSQPDRLRAVNNSQSDTVGDASQSASAWHPTSTVTFAPTMDDECDPAPRPSHHAGRKSCVVALFQECSEAEAEAFELAAIAEAQQAFGADTVDEEYVTDVMLGGGVDPELAPSARATLTSPTIATGLPLLPLTFARQTFAAGDENSIPDWEDDTAVGGGAACQSGRLSEVVASAPAELSAPPSPLRVSSALLNH